MKRQNQFQMVIFGIPIGASLCLGLFELMKQMKSIFGNTEHQLMLKADRTQHCSVMESMDPENVLKENKNTPLFVFVYFM